MYRGCIGGVQGVYRACIIGGVYGVYRGRIGGVWGVYRGYKGVYRGYIGGVWVALNQVATDGICLPSHRLALDSRHQGSK